jgi:hypothetical protein
MKRILSWSFIVLLLGWMAALAWAATQTGVFTAADQKSAALYLAPDDSATFTLVPDSTTTGFIGTVVLEKSKDNNSYETIQEITGSLADALTGSESSLTGSYTNNNLITPVFIRLRVSNFDDAHTSQPISYSLADVSNVYIDAEIKKGVVKTRDNVTLMTFKEDVVNIPALTYASTSQAYVFNTGAKVGTTAGWLVNGANNLFMLGDLPSGSTASTLIVPISGLHRGDAIVSFHLIGQVESTAAGSVTLDADLRYLTAVADDATDNSLGSMTQLSASADAVLSSSNTSKTLSTPHTIAAGETFYVKVTGTAPSANDVALQGIAVIVNEAH